MYNRSLNQTFCFLLSVLIGPVSLCQSNGAEFVPCQEMPDIIQQYNADYRSLLRYYSPATGTPSRVGNAGIGSPERRQRLQKLGRDYLAKLQQINFPHLSQECKVDYVLLKRDIQERLYQLAQEETEYNKVKQWIPFAGKIYVLEKDRRRGIRPEAEIIAKEWTGINKEIKALDAQLKTTKNLALENIYTASEALATIKRTLASIHEFYNGYDPSYTWWLPKTYQLLDESLAAYIAQFKSKYDSLSSTDKSGIVGRRVGRTELVRQLNYEMISYTPEELINTANKEFAWCEREMLKASAEMGFGNDWKAALEKVKNTFVPAGGQPEAIFKLYNESVDFLKKKDLITIPPIAEETWGMIMMTPERQLINPFFTGGADISISYPTNTMSYEDRMMSMRGNNPHFSRATVHHELIAGHSLQYFMNARHRTYRNFDTPFWMEGWALYWELLLWDMKFPQGPEDRVGMLFWHMHRCARIIFSLNYHMGKWTPQQCIDFLVDRVGHERANAEGEVRRSFEGRYPPLYQLAYLTGGRQFYALKKELVDSGKMSFKQYHDAVMQLNAMPVEMIRAILTNQPLVEDYQTKWKFYEGQEELVH
jgi:uncharacterized protein (DUF885 family)